VKSADELYRAAQAGDMAAGRELIKLCRKGMIEPYWEAVTMPSDEIVEKHLKRRQKLGTSSR
jgi:hypothetical protein